MTDRDPPAKQGRISRPDVAHDCPNQPPPGAPEASGAGRPHATQQQDYPCRACGADCRRADDGVCSAPKAKAHTQASGEEFATGAITTINAHQVKLVSGETFTLASGVRTAPYKAGDRVSVRFTVKDGAKTADQIMAARN